MATMVCRSPQPCVESQFIETAWPRIAAHLKFRPQPLELYALKSCFPDLDSSKSLDERGGANEILPPNSTAIPAKSEEIRGWKLLAQAKSAMATNELQQQQQEPYVHPLVKRSRSAALSEKSLALCTENLGNETGVDFVEDAAIFSDLKKIETSPTRKRVKSNIQGNKKFPPPLTTITGIDAIRVQSYREDGRLIMEAVRAPARASYFQVERSHGRLRLSILKSSPPKFDSAEEKTNDDVEAVGEEGNCQKDVGGKVEENGNVGGAKIEIEKIGRPCRCKCNKAEENHNNNNNNNNNNSIDNNNNGMLLLTREPVSLWVVTS